MQKKHTGNTLVAAVVAGLGLTMMGTEASSQTFFYVTRVLGPTIQLAGHDLNGFSLNGEVLDGSKVVSVSTTDARLDGRLMEMVEMTDSKIVGYDYRGRFVSHNRMVGVIMNGALDDGDSIRLRVEDLYRSPDPEDHDTFLYEVSYETDEGWSPLCGVDELGDPVAAVALEGRWDFTEGSDTGGAHFDDPSAITFACRGYVLAKCVEAGYKPWKRAMVCAPGEGCHLTSLAAHHQACTRMLRADYCGNGESHTVNQVPVNLYDDFGVRYDSQDWSVEAEWDEDGAICAVTERIEGDAPECVDWLSEGDCGDLSHFADGALLISEVAPPLD